MSKEMKKPGKDIVHWIVIDDDIRILDNIYQELKECEIDDNMIHCLCPVGQMDYDGSKEMYVSHVAGSTIWLDLCGNPFDRDFVLRHFDSKNKKLADEISLFSLLHQIQDEEGTQVLNFVFFIDILFQKNCGFCGFDIYHSIKNHISPEYYVVKFLSCLSRSLVEQFIYSEYQNVKLGLEQSVYDKDDNSNKRSGANKYIGIDKGFYSKAVYREEHNTVRIKILDRNTVEQLKCLFPRNVTSNDIFWTYNCFYYREKTTGDRNIVDCYGTEKLKVIWAPYNQKVDRNYLFSCRELFLNTYYNSLLKEIEEINKDNKENKDNKINKINKDNKSKLSVKDIIPDIVALNSRPNHKLYVPFQESNNCRNKLSEGLHLKYDIIFRNVAKTFIRLEFNKSPLYREEVEAMYKLLSPKQRTVDVLFIGEPCEVKLSGKAATFDCIKSLDSVKGNYLQSIVESKRPKYIIVTLQENVKVVLNYITEITKNIPFFSIHGFGVYFSADAWASIVNDDKEEKKDKYLAGIGDSCVLNNTCGEFDIQFPMSPVFWKLFCLLNFKYQLDTIQHELVHKIRNVTETNWKETCTWMSFLYRMKSYDADLDKSDNIYLQLASEIESSTYDEGNAIWKIGREVYKKKALFNHLKLSCPQREKKIIWILISENNEMKECLLRELNILSQYPYISNNLIFNNDFLIHWKLSDINDRKSLESKLKAFKGNKDSQFVFLFDNNIPVYISDKKYKSAIQIIAGMLMDCIKTYRVLFTYKPGNRLKYFNDREYLTVSDKDMQTDIDKKMKDIADARQLFLFYSHITGINDGSVNILTPDVLFFIRKDLAGNYSLNKDLSDIFESRKVPYIISEEVNSYYEKFFKSKTCGLDINNVDIQIIDNWFTSCNWSGYALSERDNVNFFIDRLIQIFKFVILKIKYKIVWDDKTNLYSDELSSYKAELNFKKYKLSHEGWLLKWDYLFEHEKAILFKDDIIIKIINSYNYINVKREDVIKDALSEFFYFSKDSTFPFSHNPE